MKNYYKIATYMHEFGKFELWESKIYGDEAPALLTLNGATVMETYDDIYTAVDDYLDVFEVPASIFN